MLAEKLVKGGAGDDLAEKAVTNQFDLISFSTTPAVNLDSYKI